MKKASQRCEIDFNPCLQCGACCAFYRASFYWAELAEFTLGGVPSEYTVKINDRFVAMKGTQCRPPRCIALKGEIGNLVYCSIYERRASICRSFLPSWQEGRHNPRCDEARGLWALPPLTPDTWWSPDKFPKSA